MVFLHGAAVNGAGFHTVARRLPELRSLIVDLPGHGRSPGDFTIEGAAAALRPLLQSLGGDALLVGHSLGGQVALEAVRQAPGLASGVIVLGAIVDGFPSLGAAHAIERVLPRRPVRLPGHSALLRIARAFVHVPAAEAEAWGADLQRVQPDAFVRAIVASLAYTLPAGLEHFDRDTLILVAEHDYSFVHSSGRTLLRALPRARLALVRGEPHTWHMLRPQLLADTIRAFRAHAPLPDGLEPISA